MDGRPVNHDRPGALPRELPCPVCWHLHRWLPCEYHGCDCESHVAPGEQEDT